MEVETLLPQLQDTLSQLRTALKELSTKAQNDELDQSEQKRERLLADLETSFQKERQALEAKRQTEQEDIKKKRKQEDEERAAQRQREDEELKKAKTKEDKKRQQKYDREVDSIEDETEHKMDEIEEVAQRMAQEGKKKVHDLDEKRRVSKPQNYGKVSSNTKRNIVGTESPHRRATEPSFTHLPPTEKG